MAATRSHAPSSHARLHKRGNSASSITSPLSPLSADSASFSFNRSETPRITYEESWNEPARPMPAATSSKPLKIKPYLRKFSSKDNTGLDLSRPAAENEGLAGLGISEYGNPRTASDVNFNPVNGRSRHNRSTSNTSQFSTSSSLQRPTAPYLPSIRQTPRPYTPPISKSTPPSLVGSELEADDIMTDEEFRLRQNMFDPARRSGSVSSVSGVSPALRIQTTGSSTRLGHSYSATSLSLTSPVGSSTRPRGDTLKSLDTTSPGSRTSFDKAFSYFRPRDYEIDPTSRAASIAKARMAYNEKEAAKERKYEKEANKQAEKDNKKKYRQEERYRRKSESEERRENNRNRSVSNEKTATRPSVAGREYSDHRQAHSRSLPALVTTVDSEKTTAATPQVTKTRAAKGRWLRFVTWFKTRLLRISCI